MGCHKVEKGSLKGEKMNTVAVLYHISFVSVYLCSSYTHTPPTVRDIHEEVRNLFIQIIQLEEELLDMLIIDWYLVTLLLQKGRYQLSLVIFFFNITFQFKCAQVQLSTERQSISLRDESKVEDRKVLRTELKSNSVVGCFHCSKPSA